MAIKIDSGEYRDHVAEEKVTYSKLYEGQEAKSLLTEPAPQAWFAVEQRISDLLATKTGGTRNNHIAAILNAGSGRRLLSLGSGPGGVELMLARLCPGAWNRYQSGTLEAWRGTGAQQKPFGYIRRGRPEYRESGSGPVRRRILS